MGRHIVGIVAATALLLAAAIFLSDGLLLVRYLRTSVADNGTKNKVVKPVSVVIPTYNAASSVADTIASAKASEGVSIEVIVVDDGSTDDTRDIVRAIDGIMLVERPHEGKWAALNAGISLATNPHVITMDADTIAERDALKRISVALDSHDAAAGCLLVANSDSLLGDLQAQELLRIAAYRRVAGSVDTISGPLAGFRKDVLHRVPFPPSIVEDFEHTVMLTKAGHSITYVPDAKAYTSMPESLKEYLAQRVRWSRGTLAGMRRLGVPRLPLLRGYLLALVDVLVVPLCIAAGTIMPLVILTILEGGLQMTISKKEHAGGYRGAPAFFVLLIAMATLVLVTSLYAHATLHRFMQKTRILSDYPYEAVE